MQNMKSAKDALQAELKQAREGTAFYQKRVAALEEALEKLAAVDGQYQESAQGVTKKRGRKADVPAKAAASKPAATGKAGKLPSTGKDFWSDLLSSEPQSTADIFKAAVRTLGIRPNPESKKKLTQRMSNALSVMVKEGQAVSMGTGRIRHYTKPDASDGAATQA